MKEVKAGKDRYGHFVTFGDFRSAMPDEQTAKEVAASNKLLEVTREIFQIAQYDKDSDSYGLHFTPVHYSYFEKIRKELENINK